MIRNERQYRTTKAQLEAFDANMRALEQVAPIHVHPRIRQAQREALRSQADELREEVAAYERLQRGASKVLELTSLAQLPSAIIQARIAAGLTQRELAERLGMKEQQLQRYEATEYAGASLGRVRSIMDALNMKVREDVFLPGADVSLETVLRRAQAAGLTKDLVCKRIAPRQGAAEGDDAAALSTAGLLNRIFGWAPAVLFGDSPLTVQGAALTGARFKLPQNAASRTTEAYATYAHYVAGLMLRATPALRMASIPADAGEARDAIRAVRGELSFDSALDFVWSLGVCVLPLADPGAFHGATWRIDGRNIIVLKQGARLESRWLHDLLHELRHAAEEPEAQELAFIDYDALSKDGVSSASETAASMFAGDVMLNGRAEELAQMCASEASGSIERLKATVPRVAKREGVSTAALANYMAFRLSLDGKSWWGVAQNLQTGGADPWKTARDRALMHLDLTGLDDAERAILLRALEGDAP